MDVIGDLATQLGVLKLNIEGVAETATESGTAIGSAEVREALDEFSNNWKTRRGRLIESIDAVQGMAAQAETSFSTVDLNLANEILGI